MPRLLLALGLLLVLAALVWMAFPRALAWFGRLPGDLRIEGPGGTLLLPLASMVVVSIVGSAALNLIAWLVRRFG